MKLHFTSLLLFVGLLTIGTNSSAQWKQSAGYNTNDAVRGFLGYAPYLLADASASGGSVIDSLFASTDNGQSWLPFAPHGGMPLAAVLNGVNPNLVGTAAYPSGGSSLTGVLSYSSDFGKTWAPDTLGWPDPSGLASLLTTVGTTIYGTNGGAGIYQQTSPGAQWTPDTVGMNFGGYVLSITSLVVSGNTMFAGSAFLGGVLTSTNQGASWTFANNGMPSPQPDTWTGVSALAVSGNSVFAMVPHNSSNADTLYDFYRTTDNGLNWSQMNSTPLNLGYSMNQFGISGQDLFVAGENGINVSFDNGATWTVENQGLTDASYISSMIVSGGNLVIGRGLFSQIWYRPISEFVKSSVGSANQNSFSLSENYPNPVNSVSKIDYTLAKDGTASLTLFDVTGKQVASLANGYQLAGDHSAVFDGAVVPSGIYFYRLTTAEGSIGRWLQLIK